MDVSPWLSRAKCSIIILASFFLISCGNRFDLSTVRGRQARIDEANFFLSKGACGAALEAINPLYALPQVDDEVRIITASAYACSATFNLLTIASNLSGTSNYFAALAKSMVLSPGEGGPASMYSAMDVLTSNGTNLSASVRSTSLNTYMVFIQMGVISAILREYGRPDTLGVQGADMVYDTGSNPGGEMSNTDACALAGAFSHLVDSYTYSSLSDADTASVVSSINSICVSAGLASCSSIDKNRSSCDGTNAQSVTASAVVTGVNNSW